MHGIVFLLSLSFLFTLGIGALLFLFISLDIPAISSLKNYQPPVASRILDADGEVVARICRRNRTVVSFRAMPSLLPQAFVAAEDARFYQHGGVDAWSIFRALVNNLRTGGRGQGGSTITQQVARSLLLTPEKTYTRKLKEAILAYRIDKVLSKEQILHIYLNQIYLGEGAYGVAAAAETYFGKEVGKLHLAEIAILAGLPQAPSRYSPLKHYQRAKRRQVYVLNRMAEEGFITPTAARKAYRHPLFWAPPEQQQPEDQYYVQFVRNYMKKKYGKGALAVGGYTVHTSLDRKLQRSALKVVGKGIERWAGRQGAKQGGAKPQAALLAMEIATGKVRAMIGGADFTVSQFNRAVQARRQPGSAFKPVVFAAALAGGLSPATLVDDAPLQLAGNSKDQFWEPRNFDGRFLGPTSLRDGLIHSRNIITIKLLQHVGIPKVVDLAHDLGIHSSLTANLSLALGSSGVSLQELTGAYATLGNGGRLVSPAVVVKVVDRDGRVLERSRPSQKQVLDARTAFQVTHLLQNVIAEGTGRAARGLKVAAAGKTGTTDRNMDAWFVGYTPDLAVGVWMGFDQTRSLGKRETGGRAAAPIWLDFMRLARSYLKKSAFATPDGIVFVPVGHPAPGSDDAGLSWEPFLQEQLPWRQENSPVIGRAASPAVGEELKPPL
ncbi:penicillin-binding protein 1A [Thermodesulfobacteriota bacterium]